MNNKRNWLMVPAAMLLSLGVVLAGCGNSGNNQAASPSSESTSGAETTGTAKLHIMTSFYPMEEFTSKVAGNLADVEVLIPPGTEPHDWEPTPQDIAKMTQANMIVYNGAGMESWIDQVKDSIGSNGPVFVEASKGVKVLPGIEEEGEAAEHSDSEEAAGHSEEGHDHGAYDPHVWLSPVQAQTEVKNIEAALIQLDPTHADQYKQNADAYIKQLEQLAADYKAGLSNTKRKDFITQHAAFAYMARDYGLTQVPITGLSPEQEPTAAQMAKVVDFAKQHHVKTIFFETLVSPQIAQTIANEVGAKTAVLNPLEGLTDAQVKAGEDYISVMRENLAALEKALNE
ncbi:metal ABC transporter substrate-binding protein [Paenibacillus campi]|uniref:metal ABC transporter substrate-binding protein n=1 Tax=Paenibacillus campi TaxID=3106031 RepID=UPI002AFF2059|nr:metal ABC transporter substrate-binding protein [Paenibacillus sp. SGZ-1009]